MYMERSTQNIVASAVIAFVIGFALSYVIFGIDKGAEKVADTNDNTGDQVASPITPTNDTDGTVNGDNGEAASVSLSVPNQEAGSTVTVSRVVLPERSWVAVHEGAGAGDNPDITRVLGARRLPAGEHSDVTFGLQRATEANMSYWMKIHTDDGDSEFETDEDIEMTNAEGNEILATFKTDAADSEDN